MVDENYLREISESLHITTTQAIGAVTVDKLGEDIPIDKVRHIWRITVSTNAAQKLGIYAGETGNQQSVELSLQELIVTNLLSIGDDPKKPLYIIRPERAADGTTITNNQTGFAHETSAIEVDAEYYDL